MLPPIELIRAQKEFALFRETKGIYHDLYWSRLFTYFYRSYPFLTRLFGYAEMREKLLIPYLAVYPPKHWSLHVLDHSFIKWLKINYQGFVLEAAQLDAVFLRLYVTSHRSFPKPSSVLYLQPTVALWESHCDLLTLREKFLEQSVEYWETHSFPEKQKSIHYFMIFRSPRKEVEWRKISKEEYELLHAIKEGKRLEEIVEMIESEAFPLWIYEWAQLGLLRGNDDE